MYSYEHYGVVYTPRKIASFVADLLIEEYVDARKHLSQEPVVLDPACGEGVLLEEFNNRYYDRTGEYAQCFGIDIDAGVILADKQALDVPYYRFICQNSLVPSEKARASAYWKHKLNREISLVIANPPWSTDKIFTKKELDHAGYCFDVGQYDSYVLFIELCLKLAAPCGLLAFIIPDSLFSGENQFLREYLIKNTEILVLARLGEKLFPNINRATSVMIVRKHPPAKEGKTKCYRLGTEDRRRFLSGSLDLYENYIQKSHSVLQQRFLDNLNYVFDIDVHEEEETLLSKIEKGKIDWKSLFRFTRGVEISKSGMVVVCEHCKMAQGYSKSQMCGGTKRCSHCGKEIIFANARVFPIIFSDKQYGCKETYVGENVQRYRFDGVRYIRTDVKGLKYKEEEQYLPPKILIRKTGLGIYGSIDYKGTYTSQTVYSLSYTNQRNPIPLEYYLGVLNSRVMYYYYLKKYGENEWKSHPYLTKEIIFSLPVKAVGKNNQALAIAIAANVRRLERSYSRALDILIEKQVMQLYGVTTAEAERIQKELNELPELSAISQMKVRNEELYV